MNAPRSVLYVPASRPAMIAKAVASAADAVVVDLEDGVAPPDKTGARAHVRAAVADGVLGAAKPWMLRLNAAETEWHAADLALATDLRAPRIVVAKAESAEAVESIAAGLEGKGVEIALMIETAKGVAYARELAGCHPGVAMLLVGSADLRLSLGARPDAQRAWEAHALSAVLVAARAHDCAAIDSVYFHYRDREGLERHARIARDLGYDGKSCIHPDQLEPIHSVWTSTPEEIEWACKVREAWREQDGAGKAVVTLEGEMIEALHLRLADRILARADRSPGVSGYTPST